MSTAYGLYGWNSDKNTEIDSIQLNHKKRNSCHWGKIVVKSSAAIGPQASLSLLNVSRSESIKIPSVYTRVPHRGTLWVDLFCLTWWSKTNEAAWMGNAQMLQFLPPMSLSNNLIQRVVKSLKLSSASVLYKISEITDKMNHHWVSMKMGIDSAFESLTNLQISKECVIQGDILKAVQWKFQLSQNSELVKTL